MTTLDSVLFNAAEQWAAAAAQGWVEGRLPVEDNFGVLDFISRLTFPVPPGLPSPPLPALTAHCAPPLHQPITSGPFHGLLSLKIPKILSQYLGLPRAGTAPHTARIVSVNSPSRVMIPYFPTCTDKGIFSPIPPHPPHPVIHFSHPVGRVHVKLLDRNQFLWDSVYDLKGRNVLDNSATPIAAESRVADYIPACAVGKKTFLNLQIDAEIPNQRMQIQLLNPPGGFEHLHNEKTFKLPPPADSAVPLRELNVGNATICKMKKVLETPAKPLTLLDSGKRHGVHLPEPWASALWRLDRGREETSDLNPHGMPMMDIGGGRESVGKVDSFLAKLAPTSVGDAHFIPRRPSLLAEIQVDQLVKGNFGIFDSRLMPSKILQVDRGAILQKPGGFHQPTVDRTLYSSMWQGLHAGKGVQQGIPPKMHANVLAKPTPLLHPSLQFKHPANLVHVRLTDRSNQRPIWDAIFNANGSHKIAADQAPIGGAIPNFFGINPPPGGAQFSFKVDVDNPQLVVPNNPTDRVMEFWRQAEFLFGATRPAVHSDVLVGLTSGSAAKWF